MEAFAILIKHGHKIYKQNRTHKQVEEFRE